MPDPLLGLAAVVLGPAADSLALAASVHVRRDWRRGQFVERANVAGETRERAKLLDALHSHNSTRSDALGLVC